MIDDRLAELLRQLPAGVEIDEIVEAKFLALELGCAGDAEAGAVGVEGGALVGVFTVAQGLGKRHVDAESGGQARSVRLGRSFWRRGLRNLIKRGGNCGIVSGSESEGLFGQTPAGFAIQTALVRLQFFNQGGIIGDASDDGNVFKVLGCRADHGRPADIDVLDEVAEGNAGLSCGLFEGIEIYDDHVDGLDAVSGDGGLVFLISANVKEPTMNFGVKRFHTAVEHLGEAGKFADVLDGEAGVAQSLSRAAGGNQLNAKAGQGAGKVDQAGFVSNTQKSAPNLFHIVRGWAHDQAPLERR